MKKISIVIPCHNEESNITKFTESLISFVKLESINAEIIFVENGSKDRTFTFLSRFSKLNSAVKIIKLENANFGEALKTGILSATGQFVVVFNVDFWDSRLLLLTKVNILGYDMVVCSKNLPASIDERQLMRRVYTKLYNILLKILFNFRGTDTTGIRVIRRNKFIDILRLCHGRSGVFDSELSIYGERQGLTYLELPVRAIEIRSSRFPPGRLKQTLKDLYRFYREFHR